MGERRNRVGLIRKIAALLAACAFLVMLSGCGALNLSGGSLPSAAATSLAAPSAEMVVPAASAQTASPTPASMPTPAVPSSVEEKPAESPAEIAAYFEEIAFSSEYGGVTGVIRKWTKPLAVKVTGDYTPEDMAALGRAMAGLNAIDGFPGVHLAPSGGNVALSFVPLERMSQCVGGYVEGNWGFFTTYAGDGGIDRAQIAIATDVTTQEARNHLIFEELLQSTGLMQDAYDYPDSIYYGNWTTVQQPMPLDWELLRLLYLPEIRHGMPQAQAMEVIQHKLGVK